MSLGKDLPIIALIIHEVPQSKYIIPMEQEEMHPPSHKYDAWSFSKEGMEELIDHF